MTKENFTNKWAFPYNINGAINPYFVADLEAVIATEIAKVQEVSNEDMIEFADFVEKSNYDSDGFTQHQTPQELLQLFKQQKQPKTIYFKN